MTRENSYLQQRDKSAGDVAVDGLLAGLLAGLVMGAFLVVADWIAGISPAETLGRFDPGAETSAFVGTLFHLALSGLYGVVYALVFRVLVRRWPAIGRYGWLLGAGYGFLLWLGAEAAFVGGLNTAVGAIPTTLFILAHVLFGAVLGLVLARLERAPASA